MKSLKKVLALFIMIGLLFTSLQYTSVTALSEKWNGSIVEINNWEYDATTNTYTIYSAEELAGLASQVNNGNNFTGYIIKLGTDIVLNDTSNWKNWNTQPPIYSWTPIGFSNSYCFSGIFDGAGHTISGLYKNDINSQYQGLFGYVKNGTVKNVGEIESFINTGMNSGGIIGYIDNSTIENSYFTGNICGGFRIGGLVGQGISCNIKNCYNVGSINSTSNQSYTGGIAGELTNSNISNCYNAGNISGVETVAGIVASFSGAIQNSYNCGNVTGAGGIAGVISTSAGTLTLTSCYNTGSITGSSFFVGGVFAYNQYGTLLNVFNTGTISGNKNYVGGVAGYSNRPITNAYNTGNITGNMTVGGIIGANASEGVITNALSTGTVNGADYIGGVAGINYGQICNGYYCNDNFLGEAFGEGSGTINNYISPDQSAIYIKSSEFLNVSGLNIDFLPDTYLFNDGYPLLRVFYEFQGEGIELSPYKVYFPIQLRYLACLTNNSTVYNSKYYKLMTNIYLGAKWTNTDNIVTLESGNIWTPIGTNSNNFYGTFDGSGYTIRGLYINGSLSYQGLFGYVSATGCVIKNVGVTDAYIKGANFIGGVAGYIGGNAAVINCFNAGSISGQENIGGVIGGAESSTVAYCCNTGDFNGVTNIGGVIGHNIGTIWGTVRDCYNTGNGSGEFSIGGIVGLNDVYVRSCYSSGNVTATLSNAGGIAGYNNGSISNCYYNEDIFTSVNAIGNGLLTLVHSNRSTEAFASGEISYLLQGVQQEFIWGQSVLGGKNQPEISYLTPTARKVHFVSISSDETLIISKYVLNGTPLELPTLPEKEDYTHTGWINQTTEQTFIENTKVTEDNSISAVWEVIPPAYTIYIPESINTATQTGEFQIVVSDTAHLLNGRVEMVVNVPVDGFTLVNATAVLPFSLYRGSVLDGILITPESNTVASFTGDGSQTIGYTIQTPNVAGLFSGQITFNSSYQEGEK